MPFADLPDQRWLIESRVVPLDLSVLAEVRSAVRAVLAGCQSGAVVDDIVLVASELVANALRHGCVPLAGDGLPTDRVRLGVCSGEREIMLFVCDPSPEAPVHPGAAPGGARGVDFGAVTGRGLELVTSLSSAWGWMPGRWVGRRRFAGADAFGKTVWATFRLARLEGGAA